MMIIPQAIASMGMKAMLRRLIGRFGYRTILVGNTILMGALLASFVTIGMHSPLWYIVLLSLIYGGISSLQYTSMNTLVFVGIEPRDTSKASSISSTVQQMSNSFGVAFAGMITALFIPYRAESNPALMIHGIHEAFLLLAAVTVISSLIFTGLRRGDGGVGAQRKTPQPEG